MKILLLMPDAGMHRLYLGAHVRSFREAPISLTTLAALTDDDSLEYRLVDESVDPVPLDHPADLVGISVLTGTSRRAYALADHFRRRGIPVVLGGIHVTLMPEEAARHADAIVVGMAEQTWPQVVADARAGALRSRYDDPTPDGGRWVEGVPTPRWDLQRLSGYMVPHVVQATRGCHHSCDFCTVPAVWRRFKRRPVADVVRDVKAIPRKRFVISDVSPFDDIEYAKELLSALIPLKKKWGGLATTKITRDPELFDLLVRSGCQYLLLGFESIDQPTLKGIRKGFNKEERYDEVVRQLHQARIAVQGCFVFGFDHDTPEVFAETVERVQELKIDIPRYSIYTPYPGTRLFRRLEAEGRMLSYDWADYDTMHVVFRPAQMSPVELYEGFRWAYRETFRFGNILQRTIACGRRFPITFIGNLAYRMYVKRLQRGRGFELPVAPVATTGEVRTTETVAATAPVCAPEAARLHVLGEA